jgi:hypothetical protein
MELSNPRGGGSDVTTTPRQWGTEQINRGIFETLASPKSLKIGTNKACWQDQTLEAANPLPSPIKTKSLSPR